MQMFGRPRPDDAPELSGTNFATKTAGFDTNSISPNQDSLGRSIAPDGKAAKSDANKTTPIKKKIK